VWRAWFYERSRVGRWLYEPLVGAGWILMLAAMVFRHAAHGAPRPWAFPIVFVGFALFLAAKVSVLRKGVLLSFGATVFENASRPMKVCYAVGWLLMIAGFVLSFGPAPTSS